MNIAVITAHAEGCHVLSVIAQDWSPPVTNFKLKTGAAVFHLTKSPRRIFHPAMHSRISVRFISLPEEWKQPGYVIHRESKAFMKRMLDRKTSVRVAMIDEFGTPWIFANTIERGRRHYHSWAITEQTGWRMVVPRMKKRFG